MWFAENIGTIIVVAILLLVVGAAVFSIVRSKRKGKSPSCGCGCANCAMHGSCHKKSIPSQNRRSQLFGTAVYFSFLILIK